MWQYPTLSTLCGFKFTHTAFAMLSTRLKPNPVSEYQSFRDVRMRETDTLRNCDRHEEINLEMDMWMIRNRLASAAAVGFIAHLTLSLSLRHTGKRPTRRLLTLPVLDDEDKSFCFTTLKTKNTTQSLLSFLSVFSFSIEHLH